MKRRDFLKLTGLTGTLAAAGCVQEPTRHLIPFLNPPDDIIPGKPTWFATSCRQCPAGCGILAKNRETRIVKLEGNPEHPVNRGKLCARGQAGLQDLYSPDRLTQPAVRREGGAERTGWDAALEMLRSGASRAKGRIVVLSGVEDGLAEEVLAGWLKAAGPGGQFLFYEPVSYEELREGNRLAFGRDAIPACDLSGCDLLVSVGADFLDTWISPVEYARQFAEARDPHGGKAGFLYAGPRISLTGAAADRWIPLRPGAEADFAFALLACVMESVDTARLGREETARISTAMAGARSRELASRAGVDIDLVKKIARRIDGAKQPLVLADGSTDAVVAANIINWVTGSAADCMDFSHPLALSRTARGAHLRSLVGRMEAGDVKMLLVHRSNPVYNLPGFAAALKKVPFVVALDSVATETTAAAHLVLPLETPYESWGTYAPRAGLLNCMQPTMGPAVKEARSLAAALGREKVVEDEGALPPFYGYLAEQPGVGGEDPERVLDALARGFVEPPVSRRVRLSLNLKGYTFRRMAPVEGLQLVVHPSLRWFDGRDANKTWMLEIPDPLTMITWDGWVEVHPDLAASKGLAEGDVAEITTPRGSAELGVHIRPGIHPQAVAVAMGLGHHGVGRYADGIGINPVLLTGGAPRIAGTDIAPTGRRMDFAHVDGSSDQHGRGIAQATFEAKGHHAGEGHHGAAQHHEFPVRLPIAAAHDPKVDIYPPHAHDRYRWGMIIDLDRCIGCSACVAACYAENNVAVVGKARVLEGREMAWIRIERYLEAHENPGVRLLPMLCQHCDNAPCESVCPVYAPSHNKEGMNIQVYNRCIGTRFCSQNCPYKVRRFNFFYYKADPSLDLQLNPDVTVRSKGVMEKCSFCVQRVKAAHQTAKVEKRMIREGEVVPACAQACPTSAIVFGNFLDPQSRIRKLAKDERAYQVLAELLTKPGVIYLKKIIRDDGLGKA